MWPSKSDRNVQNDALPWLVTRRSREIVRKYPHWPDGLRRDKAIE
jgi:hypothetical protein